jgi:tagatose 1,6-diphosphate aldolase
MRGIDAVRRLICIDARTCPPAVGSADSVVAADGLAGWSVVGHPPLMAAGSFEFGPFTEIAGDGVVVSVDERREAEPERGFLPAYVCTIRRAEDGLPVGSLNFRIGDTEFVRRFAGHIGYEIEPQHRGHHYAARACAAVASIARHHGMHTVWITVEPDNIASRRTCERLGCHLVEIVDLPPDCDMYRAGERRKCRYRWEP